jgi:hypothetical protein
MSRNRKVLIASAFVGALLVPYFGYAVIGSMPLIEDARGMASTGLILGVAAWMTLGSDAFGPRWIGVGGALTAAGLGFTAAVLETGTTATVLLGAFVALIVALWLVAVVRHLSELEGGPRHA